MHNLFRVVAKEMLTTKRIQPGTVFEEMPRFRLAFGLRQAACAIVHVLLCFLLKLICKLSQPRVPVVTKLGPIVVRLAVGVADKSDALDLLVSVLGGHMQSQRCAVILRQRRTHHLGHEQRLGMAANVKIVSGVIVPVGRLHVDISAAPCRRSGPADKPR